MICARRPWSGSAISVRTAPQLSVRLNALPDAKGLVLLVQARGSRHPGPLQRGIAPGLWVTGWATCVVDLLLPMEPVELNEDMDLLTSRLEAVVDWLAHDPRVGRLPLIAVGREDATAAVLTLAAERPECFRAVVVTSGRPAGLPLDWSGFPKPLLLIAPEEDEDLVRENREAFVRLRQDSQLAVVRGVSRLGEPDALIAHQRLIRDWCARWTSPPRRRRAGRKLQAAG